MARQTRHPAICAAARLLPFYRVMIHREAMDRCKRNLVRVGHASVRRLAVSVAEGIDRKSAAHCGCPRRQAHVGSPRLTSSRFATIDDIFGFKQVPRQLVLAKRIGQHNGGVMRNIGATELSFGRERGLGPVSAAKEL